jgi:hypothetical protein
MYVDYHGAGLHFTCLLDVAGIRVNFSRKRVHVTWCKISVLCDLELFSERLWQWLVHERGSMLDSVWGIFDISDVSERACSPDFRSFHVIMRQDSYHFLKLFFVSAFRIRAAAFWIVGWYASH